MPELPEVERFRQLLLPLVDQKLTVELVGDNHKILLSPDDVAFLNGSTITSVIRKGKQLALKCNEKALLLHMGMTGCIRTEGAIENWGGKQIKPENVEWPPKYTYLVFRTPTYTAYFCDPRKFGSCSLEETLASLEDLAPDALTTSDETVIQDILSQLASQRLGIKGILLDQKRAVSGVGNWVADEVLYQNKMHPDQTYLSLDEAATVWKTIQTIVKTAVEALNNDTSYPESWLFMYRWTKKKAGKDHFGRSITFLKSAGRTSAIVASAQKLYKRSAASSGTSDTVSSRKRKGLSSPGDAQPNIPKRHPTKAAKSKSLTSTTRRTSPRFEKE